MILIQICIQFIRPKRLGYFHKLVMGFTFNIIGCAIPPAGDPLLTMMQYSIVAALMQTDAQWHVYQDVLFEVIWTASVAVSPTRIVAKTLFLLFKTFALISFSFPGTYV